MPKPKTYASAQSELRALMNKLFDESTSRGIRIAPFKNELRDAMKAAFMLGDRTGAQRERERCLRIIESYFSPHHDLPRAMCNEINVKSVEKVREEAE